ncbi:hypothetical protein ABTZ58_00590 [Streptomyces sp. NPDC094143]|uniref:hypothetical protein n=1 Tax=Streptomyces sp. NPDC094143 TaxID=3155310 RepID=UPI003331216E
MTSQPWWAVARPDSCIRESLRADRGREPAGRENLPVDHVARLMAALDQVVSVLALSGVASVDGALLSTGPRRLVDPAHAAADPTPIRTGRGTGLPHVERVQRLARNTNT